MDSQVIHAGRGIGVESIPRCVGFHSFFFGELRNEIDLSDIGTLC